jgi:alkylation response protein AidB-like acyl-CoA dehydrogenase
LFLHAIAAGNLRALVSETATLLRDRKRAYSWGNTPEARHDPQLLAVIGELAAASFMVDAAVLAAADLMGRSQEYFREHGEVSEILENAARVAVAKVKVAVEPVSLAAAGRAYDAGGASWVRESVHLQRFWLNMRTVFSHNPTVYKARVIGDVIVNDGALPPTFF